MRASSIRAHLTPYVIAAKRGTTIRHAFSSAVASVDVYDESRVREALTLLGEKNLDVLTCVYCDAPATTWDHLEALVRDKQPSGAGHTLGNLVPACRTCNSQLGNKPWEAWLALRNAPPGRADAIRAYQGRFRSGGKRLAVRELTSEETQRFWAIDSEIRELMSEADRIVAKARTTALATKPG